MSGLAPQPLACRGILSPSRPCKLFRASFFSPDVLRLHSRELVLEVGRVPAPPTFEPFGAATGT